MAKRPTTIPHDGFEGDDTAPWIVFDLNAKQGKREHDLADGTRYNLSAHEPTHMPRHHAAIFLKDPSFKVVDHTGQRIQSLPEAEADVSQARKLALEPGQTIAHLAELTDSALLARVAVRPGGAEVAVEGDRKKMIAFLHDAPRVAELRRSERARDTSTAEAEEEEEGLSAEETRRMLAAGGSVGARDPLAMGG